MSLPQTAIVTIVPEWPTSGTGGTLGFSYLLLRSLLPRVPEHFALYVLSTSTMELVKLESEVELLALVAAGKSARTSTKGKLIKYVFTRLPNSRSRFVRDAFTCFRQRRRASHYLSLRSAIEPLTRSYERIICHVHDLETGDKVLEACRTLDSVILIHSEHAKGGMNREYAQLVPQSRNYDRYMRWLEDQYATVLKEAAAIVFPSCGALQLFREANPDMLSPAQDRIHVLRSGIAIPAPRSATTTSDPPRIFAIAQHVPEKGIDRMMIALSHCKEAGLSFRMRIAGAQTVISPELYRLREQLGLNEYVEFLGAIPHQRIQDELSSSALYIAAPRVVVFDLSLLEAMAAGAPIITSKLPGNMEALGDEYEGYFESEEELPSLVAHLLKHPEQAAKMGSDNRRRCEELFTLDKMADRYLELYSGLVHDRARTLGSA